MNGIPAQMIAPVAHGNVHSSTQSIVFALHAYLEDYVSG